MAKRKAKRKTKRKASKKRRKTAKRAKRRSGLTPIDVIEKRARSLKRNKRAAAVYRKVLSI